MERCEAAAQRPKSRKDRPEGERPKKHQHKQHGVMAYRKTAGILGR